MPLYEYQCVKCGKKTEKIERVSGPHLQKCPYCRGKVERLLTAPAIQFKGSGWYVTDYAGKPSGKEAPATDGPGADAKDSAGKDDSSGKETAGKDSAGKETRAKDGKEKKAAKKK